VPARTCGACAGPSCANALHLFARAFPVPQLTSSIHKAKEKGHRAHGQNKIMHAYGPKSTPIAQGLVEDINAKHVYGPCSAPIAQGLVYDINATHAFGLKELKRTCGFVATPIAQGLVEIINAKDTKMLMSPKAQGLVSNTHHSKTCREKYCAHDRMSRGETTKRHNSGSVGKKTTSSDETNHSVVSLLPTEEDSSRMSGGKGAKRTNSGSAVKKTTFYMLQAHQYVWCIHCRVLKQQY